MLLIACPACELHVRRGDAVCPHCDARLSVGSARALVLSASLGAGLSMFACSTSTGSGESAAEGMATTAMTSMEESSTMAETDTATADTSSTTMDATETSTGTGTDSTTETETGTTSEPPYGVPDQPCEDFGPQPITVGANAVELFAGAGQLPGTCNGSGSGIIYAFTAEAEGDYALTLTDADFDSPVLSLFGYSCWEFEVLECAMPPEGLLVTISAGETVHVVVDSMESTDGSATLTIVPQ